MDDVRGALAAWLAGPGGADLGAIDADDGERGLIFQRFSRSTELAS